MEAQKIPFGRIISVKEIGLLIRDQRKKNGVTQAKAAGLSGVGQRFLSELERGKETIEIGKALRVIYRLGLEIFILPRKSNE